MATRLRLENGCGRRAFARSVSSKDGLIRSLLPRGVARSLCAVAIMAGGACVAILKTEAATILGAWALVAIVTLALCLAWSIVASPPNVAYAAELAAPEDVTSIRMIDGQPVLFQYGRPVPAFLLPETLPTQRHVISLDGEWSFAPAPEGVGAPPGSEPTSEPGSRAESTVQLGSGGDALEWRQVLVPHIWDHEKGLETFDGPVWYRKRFALPESAES